MIKEALTSWNPDWAAKARYTCESPSLENPCCDVGCSVCYDGGDGLFDCYLSVQPKVYLPCVQTLVIHVELVLTQMFASNYRGMDVQYILYDNKILYMDCEYAIHD